MSFILDALKKSEIDRQRQTTPGLMDAGIAKPRARFPVWAIAIGALLGINLLVLLFMLGRSGAPAVTVPRGAPPPAASSSQPRSSSQHFSPLDTPLDTPVYAPEIPIATLNSPDAKKSHATRTARVLNQAATGEDRDEVLPSINEVHLTGAQALPELHLDVHVFATQMAERFVYINMRKYKEGATLQEGPLVEHIRRDGVVLNFHGLRFILPRQ